MQTTPNGVKRLFLCLRAAVFLGVLVLLVRANAQLAADVGGRAAGGVPLTAAELVTGVAAGTAAVLMTWLGVGVVLALTASVPGRVGRWATAVGGRVTPAVVRRVVGVALGVTVAAGVAPGAALATPPAASVHVLERPDPSFAPLPDPGWGPTEPGPGWVPEPPVVRPQPDLTVLSPSRPPALGASGEVVVRRGDTLWSIAARHLGAEPSDAQVAEAWPAWYDANRHLIGDDPDLLLPGQVLRAPEGVAS